MRVKKMLVLLAAALTAVFFGCSSGDDGSSYVYVPPDGVPGERVSYASQSGSDTIELELTYYVAASSSVARRAQGISYAVAASQGGTYILRVNGKIESEGKFESDGTTLQFESKTGKTFTATAASGSPPVFTEPVPCDNGTSLTISPMAEDYSLKVYDAPVYKPDESRFTGNATLYAMTNCQKSDINWDPIALPTAIGEIKNGLLTLNIPELPDSQYNPGSEGSRFISYFYTTDGGDKIVSLELLKKGNGKTKILFYVPDENNVPPEPEVYEGWNTVQYGWQGDNLELEPHQSLAWYTAHDHVWVYNDNAIAGTFINGWPSQGITSDEFTFTPASSSAGSFTRETIDEHAALQNSNGTYSIDIQNAKIAFTDTFGTTFTCNLDFMCISVMQIRAVPSQNGAPDMIYKRVGSIW